MSLIPVSYRLLCQSHNINKGWNIFKDSYSKTENWEGLYKILSMFANITIIESFWWSITKGKLTKMWLWYDLRDHLIMLTNLLITITHLFYWVWKWYISKWTKICSIWIKSYSNPYIFKARKQLKYNPTDNTYLC